ncbi:translational machinery component [Lentinus tigrinus ALCF2SS1-7]|uniref:Translational machinery component n=1 Tax=Lentinus tigrinus ALCF2SS1-6 TaxID=1328759 RepID=A0A5C2SDJ1_9APHY|nr:translational machinery component [Lentinus tigrinus ALCF2SS1-6]RPD74339.1 translational machinery component [Lentinus tigrinus ALCF2SS1-7]
MSLLRLLPAIRAPVARRACAAAFYSTPSASAPATPRSDDALSQFLDGAIEDTAHSQQSSSASTPSPSASAIASQPVQNDDPPPTAPSDSFPRKPTTPNPIKLAEKEKSRQDKTGERAPMYVVSVKATRNNTIVTFARPRGNQLVTLTGGKLGFKKSNRNGYEAGYQCAVGIIGAMEKELERVEFDWELYLNGFGQGRDAMLTALTTAVGEQVKPKLKRITDRTPLKIGGTRGQKTRRV